MTSESFKRVQVSLHFAGYLCAYVNDNDMEFISLMKERGCQHDPDWVKVHRLMWRRFDQGDDVPLNEEEYGSRRKLFDTPKARRGLKIVVTAPDGNFAAFCGVFYEPTGRFAYVEPVAAIPEYRRAGGRPPLCGAWCDHSLCGKRSAGTAICWFQGDLYQPVLGEVL